MVAADQTLSSKTRPDTFQRFTIAFSVSTWHMLLPLFGMQKWEGSCMQPLGKGRKVPGADVTQHISPDRAAPKDEVPANATLLEPKKFCAANQYRSDARYMESLGAKYCM